MKSLEQQISESVKARQVEYGVSINEARQVEYRVSINDVYDNDGLPITVSINVEKEYQKQFEAWLEDEEGNTFAHAEGGNVEY